MIPMEENPWVARFLTSADIDVIREKVRLTPPPLANLSGMPSAMAEGILRDALQSIYVPTKNGCEVLLTLVGTAAAHCQLKYPDYKSFRAQVHNPESFDENYMPQVFFLTGPGGCGKTQLLAALGRLFMPASTVDVGHGLPPLPLRSHWHVRVATNMTLASMLQPLLEIGMSMEKRGSAFLQEWMDERPLRTWHKKLKERCRYILFRDGVGILTTDEFQFMTQSDNANALLTKTLLFLCELGLPLVFIGNYSLGHRLNRRRQEEKQRLLANPIIYLPEDPDDSDWIEYLQECVRVAGSWLDIDPHRDAEPLHRYSAGLKRLVVTLLEFSYRMLRKEDKKKVGIEDIRRVYLSSEFSSQRADVEAMAVGAITGVYERSDLQCPFELPKAAQAAAAERMQKQRDADIAKASIEASLNPKEREGLRIARERVQVSDMQPKSAKVLKMPRRGKRTAEDLLSAQKAFREATSGKSQDEI